LKISKHNIEALIDSTISWADKKINGVLYADSDDGGSISLRVGDFRWNGLFYKRLLLMKIIIPERKCRNGLYTNFIERLDKLNTFGIRWHDTVDNFHLIERHRKRGYMERGRDFFIVIGQPYPKYIQLKKSAMYKKNASKLDNSVFKAKRGQL